MNRHWAHYKIIKPYLSHNQTCHSYYDLYNTIMIRFIFVLIAILQISAYNWENVNSIMYQYFLQGAYPGAVLKISNATHTLHNYNVGFLTKSIPPYSSPPMQMNTIFDIASLTKVTATLTCIMHLYEMDAIDIDDRVVDYIPQYGNNGKENTTIKNLLLHNSGLLEDPPSNTYQNKQEIMNFIYNCKLDYPIGSQYNYSDLGFILLAEIAQRVIGGPLDDYSSILFEKIGLTNSSFLPDLNETLYRIAPTEYSPERKKLMRGQVHDITAYLMGGVAGDAGLFSTADDLQAYMRFHLQGGISKTKERVFKQSTISKFYSRVDGLPYQNRRALGWDTVPIQQYPPCGNLFSLNSFGHTGYTGTMMWADRDRGLIIVFLTNRVHPSDVDITIRKVRTLISDAIVQQYDRYRT